MDRRELVIRMGALLLLVPASRVLTGCATTSSGTRQPPTTFSFISSENAGHTHLVTLEEPKLIAPPGGGVTRRTSETNGHTHVVILTAKELDAIRNGNVISKATSMAEGHDHSFDFSLTDTENDH